MVVEVGKIIETGKSDSGFELLELSKVVVSHLQIEESWLLDQNASRIKDLDRQIIYSGKNKVNNILTFEL